MPIDVLWKNDTQTILSHVYTGHWTVADFYQSVQASNLLLDAVQHPVMLVLDVQGSRTIPAGFLAALRSAYQKSHGNVEQVVLLGVNPFARAFLEVFLKIYPEGRRSHIQIVDGYEEVVILIERLAHYCHQAHFHPEN